MAGVLVSQAVGQTEWRGPQRDGIYKEDNLLKAWPEKGAEIVFVLDSLGAGFSSPVVTRDRIYISGMIDSIGYLFAFDLKGTRLWKAAYGREWHVSYPGVRGSATVAGNAVYVQSGQGRVVCLDAAGGKEVWAVDMVQDFGAALPKWGHAETMLLNGKQLICTPGGSKASVAALDAATGKVLWTTPSMNQSSGYCSPVLIKHGKNSILVTMLEKSIVGIDPSSGKLLWQQLHETKYGVNANTPIYINGNILYFSGYGQGAGMLKLSADGRTVTQIWKQPAFDPQKGGAVLLGNFLYGPGMNNRGWHCLDITNGKILYSNKEIDGGCLISAGGLLYWYNEKGMVYLVKPEADTFTIVSSFHVAQGEGQHWAHPVINSGRLYVRHGGSLLAYNIKG
jgi:outer membrane protein assembly factor BamB